MKYNYFNYNTNKYNFYAPFCPLGSIYTISGLKNNIIPNNKYNNNYINQKNKKKYSDSFKNENSLDLYQESNCHIYQLRPKEIKVLIIILIIIIFSNLIKIKNLHEFIIMGIKDISNCFNSNKNESNVISFSCYYFCDIHMNNEKEFIRKHISLNHNNKINNIENDK